jgi:DNA (cytosine-5)-methyltransferase 1
VDGHRWPAPLGCEQYEWEPPRLVSGRIPYRRQRLQALGNAVVPQVVERIGRAIITVEELMNHGMAL